MRSSALTTMVLAAAVPLFAQQGAHIDGPVDAFTTDELGHVYVLRGDVLELYDASGKRLARNSAKTFGRIAVIDAFYSLKPMVFSSEQKQIAVLDNTLAAQGSVMDLARGGFTWATLACAGVQNAFWLFDEREMSVTRVDGQLRTLATSGRLDQILGFTPRPVQMQEYGNLLYVNDPDHGVLVFDLFATHMRTLPITGAMRIQVRGDRLFFFKEALLQAYDLRTFTAQPVPAAAGQRALDMRVERDRLYVLTPRGIEIAAAPPRSGP